MRTSGVHRRLRRCLPERLRPRRRKQTQVQGFAPSGYIIKYINVLLSSQVDAFTIKYLISVAGLPQNLYQRCDYFYRERRDAILFMKKKLFSKPAGMPTPPSCLMI